MSEKQFQKLALKNEEKKRLDEVLAQILKLSRNQAQKWIKNGFVFVNKKSAKASQKVNSHDEVAYFHPSPLVSKLEPEPIPLEVIYEDKNLLVINKPAGMVVHPDETGHHNGTVVHAALAHAQHLSGMGGIKRPGIVHRLDKDTSGVLLLTKNDPTHRKFSQMFHDRKVQKTYLALVKGKPRTEQGIIDAPLARHSVNRKKMSISHQGKQAITHFKTKAIYKNVSLLELRIKTGRTHQIRVHLASIGHPIVGDETYGDKRLNQEFRLKYGLERQFLHAQEMQVDKKIFSASLSKDLSDVMYQLENTHSL